MDEKHLASLQPKETYQFRDKRISLCCGDQHEARRHYALLDNIALWLGGWKEVALEAS